MISRKNGAERENGKRLAKSFLHFLLQFHQHDGFAGDQTFRSAAVDARSFCDKIGRELNGHLVDARFLGKIGRIVASGQEMIGGIGDNRQPARLGKVQKARKTSCIEGLIENQAARGPIDDVGAVAREHKTAVVSELQLFGQRSNAVGGAPGTKHQTHAERLRTHQGFEGARRDDLIGIGERAVEIQCDETEGGSKRLGHRLTGELITVDKGAVELPKAHKPLFIGGKRRRIPAFGESGTAGVEHGRPVGATGDVGQVGMSLTQQIDVSARGQFSPKRGRV